MAERYYENPRQIQIGNQVIAVTVRRLTHSVKRDLRNFFQNYALERETGMFEGIEIPAGAIEDIVFRRGIEDIKIGGTSIQFNSPSPIDDLPDIGMGDESEDTDLYEELLKTIVDSNRFLARRYPFNMVFGQYLALVQQDKRDYEDKQKEKNAEATVDEVNREDVVGPNPTKSESVEESTEKEEAAMPTVQRIGGSDIS